MSRNRCCVPGCFESGNSHSVLHGFPNPDKNPELFRSWVYSVGGDILWLDNQYIYKLRRVCHAHFEQKNCCRFNRISKQAVPTINIPGVPLHRFPNPERSLEKFKRWISNIGGEIAVLDHITIYRNRRVCHRHFQEVYKYTKNRLCRLAYPVLHIPGSKNALSVEKDTVLTLKDSEQSTTGSADSGQETSIETELSNVTEKPDAARASLSGLPPAPQKDSVPGENLQQGSSNAEKDQAVNLSVEDDIDLEVEYLEEEEDIEVRSETDGTLHSRNHSNNEVKTFEEDDTAADADAASHNNKNAIKSLVFDPALQPVKDVMCATCCSSGRTILPLTQNKNFELMQTFCSEIKFTEEDKICWECNAMINNMNKFKQRALSAQNVLSLAMKGDQIIFMQTLSHMRTTDISGVVIDPSDSGPNTEELGLDKRKENLAESVWDHDYLQSVPTSPGVGDGDTEMVMENDKTTSAVDIPVNVQPCTEKQTINLESTTLKPKLKYKVIHIPNIKEKANALKEACKMTTLSEEELQQYIEERKRKLANNKQAKCLKCVKKFQSVEFLHRHNILRHDSAAGEHVCKICEQRFPDAVYHDLHYSKHFIFFKCSACSLLTKSRNGMLAHFDKMHREQRRVCRDCGQVFMYFYEFQYHRLAEHGPKLTCKHCGKIFREKDNFAQHLRYHRIRKKGKYKCKHCDESFSWVKLLKKHLVDTHGHEMEPDNYCGICHIQFVNAKTYKSHTQTMKHLRIAKEPIANFICEDCGRLYPTSSQLSAHRKQYHMYESCVCDLCDKVFISKALLIRHMKYTSIHNSDRVKYKTCEHCGKSFYKLSSLKAHMYTHSTERPFVCEVCGATFHTPFGMEKHRVNVHKISKRTKLDSDLSHQLSGISQGLS